MSEPKTPRFTFETGLLLAAILIFGGSLAVAVTRTHVAAGPAPHVIRDQDPDPLAILEHGASRTPNDPAAWQALGQHYFDAGRYADSVGAYARATRLDAGRAPLWSALGEARVMASAHDPMPAAAVEDFARSLALDAHDPRARYFKAVQHDLAGDHAAAIRGWLALLADTPAGAPWETDLRRTIIQVGRINHIPIAHQMASIRQPTGAVLPIAVASEGTPTSAVIPGPTPEQLQSAASIPPSQQDAMAQGMVARLEERLKEQPRNTDGWVMLIRSRMMLNQPDRAAAALVKAIAANPAEAPRLRQAASALGVP